MSTDRYTSPLSERYASKEMQYIFSPDMKFQYMEKICGSHLQRQRRSWACRLRQEQIDELKAHQRRHQLTMWQRNGKN